MADNYLITGYWGEPHVTAENDRGINAAMFGAGRFVLPVGEQFRAEYIGNNTIRMYDGKLMDNGAAAGIPAGGYVDLLIANSGQGLKRNDLIVFQYEQDESTMIETGKFVVIKGAETSGTATDPALTQEDLLSGEATFDQMALWRVSVSGGTVSAPVKLFSVYQNNVSHAADKNNPHGVTASQAGAAPASHVTDKNNPHGVTASQVGARPNTWMPTASEVGARPNTWMPTAYQVGALDYKKVVFDALSEHATLKDAIDGMVVPSIGTAYAWEPKNDFPVQWSGYWTLSFNKCNDSYTEIEAAWSDGSMNARKWIGKYSKNNGLGVVWTELYGPYNNPTPTAIGLPKFKTYYFEGGSSPLELLKSKFSTLENGSCVILCGTNGSFSTLFGFKVDNYGGFIEAWYGGNSFTTYRNAGGTWYQSDFYADA